MGIARQTLREALGALSSAGVLAVDARGRTVVASDTIPVRLLREHAELRMSEVGAVLEARRLLEPRVAQLAAFRADEADLEALAATIEAQRHAIDDHVAYMQLDYRFHLNLARATRNPTIVAMMRDVLHRLQLARDMVLRAGNEQESAIDIHVRTLDAVRRGNPDEVDAVMDEHLRHLEEVWEQEVGRPQFRPIPDFLLRRAPRPDSGG